jgi:hypothetical protein
MKLNSLRSQSRRTPRGRRILAGRFSPVRRSPPSAASMARTITALTLFAGFASTGCWPLSAYLIEHLGWREACFIYAAIQIEAFDQPPGFGGMSSHFISNHRGPFSAMCGISGAPQIRGLGPLAMPVLPILFARRAAATACAAVQSGLFDGPHENGNSIFEMGSYAPRWLM